MGLVDYLKSTKGELKHVSWPTKKQTVFFTVIIIALSIITAVFLGLFDFAFTKLLNVFVLQ